MQLPIESLNLLMLNVGFARQDGDWNWEDVSSPFTRIYYVTEGEARLHIHRPAGNGPRDREGNGTATVERTSVVTLRPGHLYIIPAYTRHSYECNGVFGHYYLHVYEGFKKETDVFERYDFPTEVEAWPGDEGLLADMCSRHPEAQLPESNPRAYDNTTNFTDYVKRYNTLLLWKKMQLRGAILILFSHFMERAVPKLWTQDERMTRVLAHIHRNLYKDISIETLAGVACLTIPYFIRTFKRELGLSPLQYINRKKVERAELLLLTNDMPVKEISYMLGYNDHSYFIRLFRKLTGTTPQEYRRRMR